MNLTTVSKTELLDRTRLLVERERCITSEILWHLFEIERRRLFAEQGFPSLFEYCTRQLKYSGSAAYRRISAMRLLKEVPEMEIKINSGELSVTTASQLQSFFIAARREENKVFSPAEKRELIEKVQGKSTRDCAKILTAISPRAIPVETERVLTPKQTEIRFVADDELLAVFARFRELAACQLGGASDYASLFKVMGKTALAKLEVAGKKGATGTKDLVGIKESVANKELVVLPAQEVRCGTTKVPGKGAFSRYLRKKVKEQVWARDSGQCSYVDRDSKRRCSGRYGLEFDHRLPFALGGDTSVENLWLLCRAHNQYYAVKSFGDKKMGQYILRAG